MLGGRPRYSFACPSCDALYELVKVEAGPETVDCEVACRSCGALSARRVAANIAKLPELPQGSRN